MLNVGSADSASSTVQFTVIFLGRLIQFDTQFDWVDPNKAAELMLEVLWEQGITEMQMQPTDQKKGTAGSWNATYGNDSCPDVADGVIALDTAPLEFELPQELAVLKEVGPMGSVEYLSAGTGEEQLY